MENMREKKGQEREARKEGGWDWRIEGGRGGRGKGVVGRERRIGGGVVDSPQWRGVDKLE